MSLDFDLINKSTTHINDSFDAREITDCEFLCFLKDFIYPPMLNKLMNHLDQDDLLVWHRSVGQENRPRKEIRWQFDSVIEEIHVVVETLTIKIEELQKKKLKFNGIMIWKDTAGYMYSRHKDIPTISAAIQIYLTEGHPELNTKFYYKDNIYQSEYKINHGYFFDNSTRMEHGIENPVPEGHTRYSLYCHWSAVE